MNIKINGHDLPPRLRRKIKTRPEFLPMILDASRKRVEQKHKINLYVSPDERHARSMVCQSCEHWGPCKTCTQEIMACKHPEQSAAVNSQKLHHAGITCPLGLWPTQEPPLFRTVAKYDHLNLFPGSNGIRFNPSIIDHQGGYALAFRTAFSNSRIGIALLDRSFKPIGGRPFVPIYHRRAINGLEDPRLFRFQGKLHVSFTGLVGSQRKLHVGVLYARLADDLKCEEVFYPEWSGRQEWEKNWVFFEYRGELFAFHSKYRSHKILKIDGNHAELVYETNGISWDYGEIHGGTQPLYHEGKAIQFFHSYTTDGPKHYFIGAMLHSFDPPFRITHYTPEPLLIAPKLQGKAARIVFPAGAIDNGHEWVISCGLQDQWCELLAIEKNKINGKLVQVPPWDFRPNTQDSWIYDCIYNGDEYRLANVHFNQDDVVIDIGAQAGSFAEAAYRKGARRIYCFEPDADNFAMLERNMGERAHVYNVGVGVGKVKIVPQFGPEATGSKVSMPTDEGGVFGYSLDEILKPFERVRFLKLDCEGAEWDAILSCELLGRVGKIAMELHTGGRIAEMLWGGESKQPDAIIAKLESAGFRVQITPIKKDGTCMLFAIR